MGVTLATLLAPPEFNNTEKLQRDYRETIEKLVHDNPAITNREIGERLPIIPQPL
jgi:hypothetical protein